MMAKPYSYTGKIMQPKAIKTKDLFWVAKIDYVCQVCHKFVKKGKSHAHPTVTVEKLC